MNEQIPQQETTTNEPVVPERASRIGETLIRIGIAIGMGHGMVSPEAVRYLQEKKQ